MNNDATMNFLFTIGEADYSERPMGPDMNVPKNFVGEGFKRPRPPLIKTDENVRKNIDALFGGKP